MKIGKVALLAGLGVGAFLLFKNQNSDSSSITSFPGSGFSQTSLFSTPDTQKIADQSQAYDITNAKIEQIKAVSKSSGSGGSVKTASSSTLAKIDAIAKASPTKTVYYPSYGIVTSGGQGYSTATPEKYKLSAYEKGKIVAKSAYGIK